MKRSGGGSWSSSSPAAAAPGCSPAAEGLPQRERGTALRRGGSRPKCPGRSELGERGRATGCQAAADSVPSGRGGQALPGAQHCAEGKELQRRPRVCSAPRCVCVCVCLCVYAPDSALVTGAAAAPSYRPRHSAAPRAAGRGLLPARPLAPGLRAEKAGAGEGEESGREAGAALFARAPPVSSVGQPRGEKLAVRWRAPAATRLPGSPEGKFHGRSVQRCLRSRSRSW